MTATDQFGRRVHVFTPAESDVIHRVGCAELGSPAPLTEARVREVVREELDRAVDEAVRVAADALGLTGLGHAAGGAP